ncbi:MAG: cysteine--tRNA ligase [Thermoflexales bacterium]|nr:cysteine--tRNA ligase [Thermoflexales bacterium]MCS7324390.1 cysteine--tRNA ligase [Thermoflexales bacterium]MCX7937813.1 cysteine--tRNA ligase [Thermoflexales bacterium]MDW8053285.1 cysteine--tRNA ligase [Anaerolineae bacterium]MDW8291936.1 cysteine--tRNA ligase [Anaerolineae bacterium]
MSLVIYNYLKREKEPFVPVVEGRVHMYVCGPTVYDHAHLGHAKTYVAFDVVVRWLRYSGYKVRYVQNITDVGHLLDDGEDRILKGARRERVEPMELVERYMRSYFEDMDALGVQRPDISPRASGHIPEQIEMIKLLIEKGYAYEVNGSVYFSVEKFPEYGKLSGRRIEEMEAGKRVAVREEKRHPMDFALWIKAPENHILKWPSPWGWGYPGWHIECSAMSTKYLGHTFDIHGGGVDNIFPHNECEIAQSEAAYGVPFANYWMLTGSLLVNGVKMSKSLGNFVTIKDALKKHRAEALRFFILSNKYNSPADYSEAVLEAATKGWERLYNGAQRVRRLLDHPEQIITSRDSTPEMTANLIEALDQYRMKFVSAMNDDFNTPLAIGSLQDMTTDVNRWIDKGIATREVLEQAADIYRAFGGDVLGLLRWEATEGSGGNAQREAALIELLIELRAEARKAKDYARADAIRQRLANLGIILEDTPSGTTWRLAS